MKFQHLLAALALQAFISPLGATEAKSEVEAYVALIRSVGDVKSRLYGHLNPECGSGVCVENNAAEVCNLVGALDVRVGGVIGSPGQPARAPELSIAGGDLQLMRRIWKQCKPTSWGYWNRAELLRVTFQGDEKEVAQLSSLLRGTTRNGPGATSTSRPAKEDVDEVLGRCLVKHAQRGDYSSFDGGQSALSLVKVCNPSAQGWIRACVARGEPNDSCAEKVLLGGQAVLKMVGK